MTENVTLITDYVNCSIRKWLKYVWFWLLLTKSIDGVYVCVYNVNK